MPVALVTGANGFIGSHLCEALVNKGWQVRGLVRRSSDLRWLKSLPVQLSYGEIIDPESLGTAVSGVDYVFHIAGVVKCRDPKDFARVNCGGTQNLLDAAKAKSPGLSKFVFVSSLAAAGPDGTNSGPVSLYGSSKLAAERIVAEYKDRLPVAVLRLPVTYGPRDREWLDMLKALKFGVCPMLGVCFSLSYVADAVEAALALALSDVRDGAPYAVSDGQTYSFGQWAEVVEAILGKRALKLRIPIWFLKLFAWWNERLSAEMPTINTDKALEFSCRAWTCDPAALQARTGFKSRYDLETGLKLTVQWYKENRWL